MWDIWKILMDVFLGACLHLCSLLFTLSIIIYYKLAQGGPTQFPRRFTLSSLEESTWGVITWFDHGFWLELAPWLVHTWICSYSHLDNLILLEDISVPHMEFDLDWWLLHPLHLEFNLLLGIFTMPICHLDATLGFALISHNRALSSHFVSFVY